MLGIICGLSSEEDIAKTIAGALVVNSGATPSVSRVKVQDLIKGGAKRIISFGVAGSLTPNVKLGDLVVGTKIVSSKGEWACDKAFAEQLAAKIGFAKLGGGYGSETLVETVEEKKHLFDTTGCLTVDMESQCMAEVAAEAGIPFSFVRTVCDDANMNVPNVVHVAVNAQGGIDVWPAIKYLAFHPGELPDVFRVQNGMKAALGSLERAVAGLRALV